MQIALTIHHWHLKPIPLIENNLIEYLDGTNKFKTTEKGLFFLKMHNELEELLPQITTIEND